MSVVSHVIRRFFVLTEFRHQFVRGVRPSTRTATASMLLADACATRAAFRNVLRAVNRHISDPGKTEPAFVPIWRDHVRSVFRQDGVETGSQRAVRKATVADDLHLMKLKAANEYALLVNAVHHHKHMLFEYGHSLEKEREQLKKAASTARYVGLDMPESGTQSELEAWDRDVAGRESEEKKD